MGFDLPITRYGAVAAAETPVVGVAPGAGRQCADLFVKDLLYNHDDHGPLSAQFKVAVEDAYAPYPPAIALGQWVELGDAHRGWDGEIASIVPSIDDAGQHWLSVACDGLQKIAARRNDLRVVFVHKGTDGWIRKPGVSEIGSFATDNGAIELRARLGDSNDYRATTVNNALQVCWVLHDEVSDGEISYLSYTVFWNVQADGGHNWKWNLSTAPSLNSTMTTLRSATATASTGGTAYTDTPPAGTKVLIFTLYCSDAAYTIVADRYAKLQPIDIYSSGLTSKVRLDEAMVTLATRPGLAVSATSKRVGPPQDHLELGSAESPLNAWSGLETLEAMHSQPITNRFKVGRTYEVGPRLWWPKDKSKIIVVGGDHPGLKPGGWQVDEMEQPAQYVEVLFKNAATGGDSTKPEGWLRRIVRPCEPPDDNVRLDSLNLSDKILTDVNAAACGDFVVGRAPAEIPKGYSFYFHPARCVGEAPYFPGDNDDTTERGVVHELSDYHAAGTVTGFTAWDGVTDGWGGSNSPADPSSVVVGASKYITFGDLSQLDFGTGPMSCVAWVKTTALGAVQTIASKAVMTAARPGWYFVIQTAGQIRADIDQDLSATQYRRVIGTTVLAANTWYCVGFSYAGSGGDITLYVSGAAEAPSSTLGAVGAWNYDNAGNACLGCVAGSNYWLTGAEGPVLVYPRALTAAEHAQIALAGPYLYHRNLSKGTVQLVGICRNMLGGKVPCDHITPIDYWIRHTGIGKGEPVMVRATAQKPSNDPAQATNALTIGEDDMLEQIAVRRATALALAETITADVTASDETTTETSSGTTGDYVVDSRRGSADRGRRKGYRKPVGRPPKKAPGGHGKSHGGAEDYDPRRRPPKKTPKPPRRRRT